jgi:aerobic carbon-monoxide dehydrogenase small subunit
VTARAVKLELNGEAVEVVVEPRERLVDVVRASGRTGTHLGCETGACGACTVLLDGRTVRSCLIFAAQCDGRRVTTIEALGTPERLHPVMASFHRCHGLQCGFCTPGMVMAAVDLLAENPDPTEAEIREGLEGNLCRCTGYQNIVRAVREAATAMRTAPAREEVPA